MPHTSFRSKALIPCYAPHDCFSIEQVVDQVFPLIQSVPYSHSKLALGGRIRLYRFQPGMELIKNWGCFLFTDFIALSERLVFDVTLNIKQFIAILFSYERQRAGMPCFLETLQRI